MSLPVKIDPCPIIDALYEIRFESNIHPSAVFGVIYNKLKDRFPTSENLAIVQIPEALRAADVNLKFKPHYKISNKDFVVQIGPDVLSVSSFPKYSGWDIFFKEIVTTIREVRELGIIEKVVRSGLRYINFFHMDIYPETNLKMSIEGANFEHVNTVIRTEINQGDFISALQVSNNINHKGKHGSIIDIDTVFKGDLNGFFEILNEVISKGHNCEKELFYSLLREEFLAKLNPTY